MNYVLDILIAAPILWGAWMGFRKGLIIELASFIALALGIYGALLFSEYTAKLLEPHISTDPEKLRMIAFGVTFVGIVLGVMLLAHLLSGLASLIALGWINSLGGAVFGVLKMMVITSLLIIQIEYFNRTAAFLSPEVIKQSWCYTPAKKLASLLMPIVKDNRMFDFLKESAVKPA